MTKPYWQQLLDPRWQKKRLSIFERAQFACEECADKTSTLQVHHLYYEKGKQAWEYPDEALKCVCEDCHLSRQAAERLLAAVLGGIDHWTLGALACSLSGATTDPKQRQILIDGFIMTLMPKPEAAK